MKVSKIIWLSLLILFLIFCEMLMVRSYEAGFSFSSFLLFLVFLFSLFLTFVIFLSSDNKADIVTLVVVLILMGIGFILQERIGIVSTGVFLQKVLSLFLLLGTTFYFSHRSRILNLERRYYLIALGTVILAYFFGVFSVITHERVFFYNRTPWEIFKITLTIVFAGYLSDYSEKLSKTKFGFPTFWQFYLWGPIILFWLLPVGAAVLLKDFGQIIIYTALLIVLFYFATGRIFYPFMTFLISILGTKFILLKPSVLPSIVINRFYYWHNIWKLPVNDIWWNNKVVYHLSNVLFSVKNGGWMGKGIGLGYANKLVPSVASDSIYSLICEEGGWVFSIIVILLYLVLIIQGLRIVKESKEKFIQFLALGFTTLIAVQVFVNIGGILGVIPLTGIPLPFLSRGGSAFLTFSVIIGFLLAIDHINKTEY